jgi:tagaturonate epimerase
MSRPVALGLAPSFGFGDRTGLATPGHVAAMLRSGSGIEPIFPQQSIREMTRTQRTPRQVMDDALNGMRAAGWTGITGADADHLKKREDVDATAAVGFTFFTIDPSEHVDPHADSYDLATLQAKYQPLQSEVTWLSKYVGHSVGLSTGTKIELNELACLRAAVKYGKAINHAVQLAAYIQQVCTAAGNDFEIELSVDETEQPTTLAEHYIIADQCLSGGMKLVSLAPRFIGDFEKGVDYKGNLTQLELSLRDHAAIAHTLGPYKLSLHSGSDKLSIYAPFARATQGKFHVKTAGTSYLEALRVAARHDSTFFRQVIEFARSRYDVDKATYHVSATLASAPSPTDVTDILTLEREYLELWSEVLPERGFTKPGRQILHCTFGSVLCHKEYGPHLHSLLKSHANTYTQVLADHFAKHLEALKAGM